MPGGMGPPIFVRPPTDAERHALEAGLRSPDAFTQRRSRVALASARGDRPRDWALGYEDAVWRSRPAQGHPGESADSPGTPQPALSAWAADDRPLRPVERAVAKGDADPKAIACYGLLLRWADPEAADGQ